MNAVRQGTPGATRTCPHCKATILDSASVCPACKHHLRFDPETAAGKAEKFSALNVEGTIRRPPGDEAWEYTMVLAIRNERGDEIARHVVGVGALTDNQERTFTLAVEAVEVRGYRAGKGRGRF